MMAIHISDPDTVVLVERLADTLKCNKTAAVARATREALERLGAPTIVERPKPRGGIKAELDARLRRETKEYVRLREAAIGKRSGTRIYAMLNRRGPVETVKRLIMGGPSEGLRFLAEQDHLELAAEHSVLDPAYDDLFTDDVKERARQNLAYAQEIAKHRKR